MTSKLERVSSYTSLVQETTKQKRKPSALRIVLALLALGLIAKAYFGPRSTWPKSSGISTPAQHAEFSWSQTKPTTFMNYVPCFGKFQCTRLDVPMDYNSTDENGSRVNIAIIRYPAPIPVTDPRYAGAVLINPGGPGGSGVVTVLGYGERLSKIVNPESSLALDSDAKFYDIISWDPRGVNNTTPKLDCFPNSVASDIFNYQSEAEGNDGSSYTGFSTAWARRKAVATGCSDREEISKHMNTPVVVADMVEIIERHAEWRSKEAESWLESKEGQVSTAGKVGSHTDSRESVLTRTQWRKGEEKLNYWGFSYGTVLGATFAALQPERSHRVIIDGVLDTDDYYSTAWLLNLRDTDKIMENFYSYCSTAGHDKCAINSGNLTSTEIKTLVEDIVSNVVNDPVAVPSSAERGPEIITYNDVMEQIKLSLYKPLGNFNSLANLLDDLTNGNGSKFADVKARGLKPSCPLECTVGTGDCQQDGMEITSAIMCSDGVSVTHLTKEDIWENSKVLRGQSKWLGEFWTKITLSCAHWLAKPKWKVQAGDIRGNTSHPLLIIGNTLDPVTPLYNAHSMSKKFPGSVVLEQNSEGHCTISSPSICTITIVRAFFQTGALPPPGVVCEPDEVPLLGKKNEFQIMSEEDEKLISELRGVGDLLHHSGPLGSL